MQINEIYNENCLDTMKRMPDNFLDLTVTSPPYDNLRTYKGFVFPFEEIARELYRVTKLGGVIVWIVGDATIKGSETGTSFRQALFFMECGFRLHDTMIYTKGGQGATGSIHSYWQDFEYMFVFVKGKLATFNPIKDRKNIVHSTIKIESIGHRHKNGDKKGKRVIERKPFGKRFNTWQYRQKNSISKEHPAVFPEQLANDHIISWSNEGDLVFDPFMGSGTTAKMAILNKRNYIGSEISAEYCEIIKKRLEQIPLKLDL